LLEGFGVGDVFLLLDAGVEGFGCVVVEDGDGALDEDGAGIGTFIYEVDGATGDFDAIYEGLFPGRDTGESRQQGWMDVENTVGEGGQHGGFDDAHEAGKNDVVGLPFLELSDVCLLWFTIEPGLGVRYGNVPGGNAVALCPGKNACGFNIRDDAYEGGVERACGDGIDDGLAVGAAAGTEYGDAEDTGYGIPAFATATAGKRDAGCGGVFFMSVTRFVGWECLLLRDLS
jgi:hypothetical protein